MDIPEAVASAVGKSIAPIAENAVATLGKDFKDGAQDVVKQVLTSLSEKEIVIKLPKLV